MRKHYFDNIRWIVIVLVVVFHVVNVYCSNGAVLSYNAPGIAALDSIGYLIYPWVMPCMFVVSGISARYALERKSDREFVKDRTRRLLLPFLSSLILIGPFFSGLSFRVNRLDEVFAALPQWAIFCIRVLNGMGTAWFLLQLFVIALILVLIRKLDKGDRLYALGGKCGIAALLLLYFPVLGSAQILYVAYTFRNGLYLLLFLLGYYVFSHERIQQLLQRCGPALLAAACILGPVQVWVSWGQPFQHVVNHWLVMLYTWIMTLAVLGCAGRWLNRTNRFTGYMVKRSYGIYYLHYVAMIYIAYFLGTALSLPKIWNYILLLVLSFVASILMYELFSRVPVLRTLFGLHKGGGRAASTQNVGRAG